MSVYVRSCRTAEKFNTGGSYCPIDPSKVKAIILATKDMMLPYSVDAKTITEMCHANRPDRIYPIKGIVEYAPSGGEAQTETKGYGGLKQIGYSAKDDVFTVGDYDMEVVKNLAYAKNTKMYVFYVDSENQIHGVAKDDQEGIFGIPAIVYVADQAFDTSSTAANYTIHVALEDVEKFMMQRTAFQASFDVADALIGLMNVRFVKVGENYKLVDSSNTDISAVYKTLKAENFVEDSVTSISFDAQTETFVIEGTPTLKTPAELHAEGISGIEQL